MECVCVCETLNHALRFCWGATKRPLKLLLPVFQFGTPRVRVKASCANKVGSQGKYHICLREDIP